MHSVGLLILGECVMVVAWVWRSGEPTSLGAKNWWRTWEHRAKWRVDDRGIGPRAASILAELDEAEWTPGLEEDIVRLVRCHQWEPLTPAMRALREAAARRSETT